MAWYTLTFAILLLLYSHTLTIAFGDQLQVFTSFFRSFYYLFGMLLGEEAVGILQVSIKHGNMLL